MGNGYANKFGNFSYLSAVLQISLSLFAAAPSASSYFFMSINNRSVKQI